jgi:hypothetical protein
LGTQGIACQVDQRIFPALGEGNAVLCEAAGKIVDPYHAQPSLFPKL